MRIVKAFRFRVYPTSRRSRGSDAGTTLSGSSGTSRSSSGSLGYATAATTSASTHGLRPDQRADRASRRSAVARRCTAQRVLAALGGTRQGLAALLQEARPRPSVEAQGPRCPRLYRTAPEGVARRRQQRPIPEARHAPHGDAPSARREAEDLHPQARRRPVVRQHRLRAGCARASAARRAIVAIDRGITNFGATSDGDMIANPRCLEASLKRLAHAQRTVSRRKKGSKNREKAKARVARIHRKVRRQRDHFLHVQSARLAKSHGVVVLEKLNVAGMMRGRCARSIADAGWSRFADMLRYKLAWSGGSLVEVPAAYSSQTCSACGCVDAESRRSQAVFRCTSCGYRDHADLNAAKILLARANRSGLRVEGSPKLGTLRSRKRVGLRVPRRSPESSAL